MLFKNYNDRRLKRCVEKNPEVIERWLKIFNAPESAEEKKDAVSVLLQCYLELAFANYLYENFAEAKKNFKLAAPFAYLHGFVLGLSTLNNEWSIQEEINYVLAFGDKELKCKLLNDSSWENVIVDTQSCLLYDHLLIEIGVNRKVSKVKVLEALECAKKEAQKDRDILQYILPLIEIIAALDSANELEWVEGLKKVIKYHADSFKFGELKDLDEGMICFNALSLAKLGLEMHGWDCNIDSPHLPLMFLDGD